MLKYGCYGLDKDEMDLAVSDEHVSETIVNRNSGKKTIAISVANHVLEIVGLALQRQPFGCLTMPRESNNWRFLSPPDFLRR